MPELLKVDGLTVSFGEKIVAEDISFSVEHGKTLAIVGESGSGKSITALSIMGLLPRPAAKVNRGSIKLFDPGGDFLDLLKINENKYRDIRGNRISMVFQEPMTSLNPVMKCGHQAGEALRQHTGISGRDAKARVISLFGEVRLPRPRSIYDSYPHELSGGQKQRVMIAMAISCSPSILIADEPTTALDVTVQKNILGLLAQIQADRGMSIIFISHDLGVVSGIADDLIVMRNGKIVERGPAGRVFGHPEHPYTKGLLACRPAAGPRMKRLPTVSDFTGEEADPFSKENRETTAERRARIDRLLTREPVLEVRHLKVSFKKDHGLFKLKKETIDAVDDVSFVVYPGETLGLVGESGCGKTTLGRTLLRLVDSSGGSVCYRGCDITAGEMKEKELRRSMQIIFQDPYASLNPRITVGLAISEPIRVHDPGIKKFVRRSRTESLLERVGLSKEYYYRYPHELSGGERQRVGIARALAVSPEFIICDESVSALDVSIQAMVLNLLNDLKEEFGFTFIFISHDLAVVRHMSDRILVMKDGRIVEAGEASRIFDHPREDYTRELVSAISTVKE